MYIDSHSHFDFCIENDKDNSLSDEILINGLKENDIKYAVQVSTDVKEFEWSYNFAKKYSNIFFTLGIHPSSKATEKELKILQEYLTLVLENNDRKLLFGIGEAGLDFYRMHQPMEMQIRSFEFQIDLADKYDLPIIVHSRNAIGNTLDILNKKAPKQIIMHCFPGSSNDAKSFLDLGSMISFAGNVTYKNAHDLKDAAVYVPIDRLLVETDAPFLTPVPLRGKQNRSEYVKHTYEYLAELRKEKLSDLVDNVYNNFINLTAVTEN